MEEATSAAGASGTQTEGSSDQSSEDEVEVLGEKLLETTEKYQCDSDLVSYEHTHSGQATVPNTWSIRDTVPHKEERACFNDLPDEIIMKIFSYLSFNDLIDNTQNVCLHWKRLSHDTELWQDKVYIVRNRCIVPMLAEFCANSLEKLRLHIYDVVPEEEYNVFNALSHLHKLKEFNARNIGARQPPLIAIPFQSGCLTQMETIDLRYTVNLVNDVILAISKGCPLLCELRLHHSPRITDDGLVKIHCLRHLKILELTDCNGLGGSAISQVAQLPSLHSLILEYISDLGKLLPGLGQIVEMKKLQSLDLLHSGNIQCIPLSQFPDKLVNLRKLHMHCNEESPFIKKLCSQLPLLKIYNSTPYTDSDWEPDYTFETDEEMEDQNLNLVFI